MPLDPEKDPRFGMTGGVGDPNRMKVVDAVVAEGPKKTWEPSKTMRYQAVGRMAHVEKKTQAKRGQQVSLDDQPDELEMD